MWINFVFLRNTCFFFFFLLLTTSSKKKVVISTQKRLSKLSWSWNLCLNSESMFLKQMSRYPKNVSLLCLLDHEFFCFLMFKCWVYLCQMNLQFAFGDFWHGSMTYVYERKFGFLAFSLLWTLNILQSELHLDSICF